MEEEKHEQHTHQCHHLSITHLSLGQKQLQQEDAGLEHATSSRKPSSKHKLSPDDCQAQLRFHPQHTTGNSTSERMFVGPLVASVQVELAGLRLHRGHVTLQTSRRPM